MSRSTWKGKFIYQNLLSTKFLKRKEKKIWARNSTIPSTLIGKFVHIHNGKKFIKIFINREKVGFKFGEFSYTRNFTRKEIKIKSNKKPALKSNSKVGSKSKKK